MPTKDPAPNTQKSHMSLVTDAAQAFVELASTQPTHQVSLEALISAYAFVAVCHPCCAQKAADLARQVADLIETHAAPRGTQNVH